MMWQHAPWVVLAASAFLTVCLAATWGNAWIPATVSATLPPTT